MAGKGKTIAFEPGAWLADLQLAGGVGGDEGDMDEPPGADVAVGQPGGGIARGERHASGAQLHPRGGRGVCSRSVRNGFRGYSQESRRHCYACQSQDLARVQTQTGGEVAHGARQTDETVFAQRRRGVFAGSSHGVRAESAP